MSSQINFFASDEDDAALIAQAARNGLYCFRGEWDPTHQRIDDVGSPALARLCYFSPVPASELHPVKVLPPGSGRLKITWATDPALEFVRSVVEERAIIAGRVWWSDSPTEFAAKTKTSYRALTQWIKRNWSKRPDGFWAGPGAQSLAGKGYEALYLPRGVVVEKVKLR